MVLVLVGGGNRDRSAVSVTSLECGGRVLFSVNVKSLVASGWEIWENWWSWSDARVLEVTVVGVVTAASSQLSVVPESSAAVLQLKTLANGISNTVVGSDVVSSDDTRQRSALSSAVTFSSEAQRVVGGLESDVALERVGWSTWWGDSWVETSISSAAASGESLFDGSTVVVQSKLPAGRDWIASVDGSVSHSSVVHGREGG